MIERDARTVLDELMQAYPVVAITGPRQSGKTTLSQIAAPDHRYVSLEDPDSLEYAQNDPRGFLEQFRDGGIIDEIQREPKLVSYIQGVVDKKKRAGQFILTASQQFGLLSNITQSLAGRVGLLELLPFSIHELSQAKQRLPLLKQIQQGFYPPIYDRKLKPTIWLKDYISTYVERDVRQLLNVQKQSDFQRFMKMCAARTGQLIQYADLARDTDLDHRTVKNWLSILEASYIVFTLTPYYKNHSKRLIKQPKLYFYDTGLACRLLNINNADDLDLSPFKGALFETMVISEAKKIKHHFRQDDKDLFFWRDNKKIEIDLFVESPKGLDLYELKSSKTIQTKFFNNLEKVSQHLQNAGENKRRSCLVYGGEEQQDRQNGDVIAWHSFSHYFQD